MALRRSLRLAHHDNRSSGGYFVTICAARRGDVFGTLLEESVALNETGEIVNKHLRERVDRAEGVAVDAAIVMPDHVHVVVMLEDGGRTLSSLVGAFKSSTAREVKRRCPSVAHPVWQRGFYDHVVRNDADLDRVRDYIATNPLRSSLRRSG